MADNPLRRLEALGQSIWLDAFRRAMLSSGELKRLIDEDGLSGVTANPSILEKAIAGSHDYDSAVRALAQQRKGSREIYESLAVEDLSNAADLFRPIYDRTGGQDGFVSLEVSPGVAYDTQATLEEARRLWAALNRPNVMIKVPATAEGIPAIQQLISEGINVNITLLFGLDRYRQVVEAYLSGLEARVKAGQPVKQIASVASFFLSRIDVLLDPRLPPELKGQVAIASARAAYAIYQEQFSSERFAKLGANKQRLLWASTSTKDPSESDVKYVEPLIGPDTVNTVPMNTLQAYRDHGDPAPRLAQNAAEAQQVLASVSKLGIDLNETARHLEEDGVKKFSEAFDRLLATLDEQTGEHVDAQKLDLGPYADAVQRRIQALEQTRFMERLWRKDASLWKSDADSQQVIREALGWLHVPEVMDERVAELQEFAAQVRAAGFQHVVHMGMGGSSLAPLVFARSFAQPANGLPLTVLDTTDPATITRIEQSVPLDKTLFIVASKSGTTAEPAAFGDYFYDKVGKGENFVAITDPGTLLERQAKERGFRKVFCNFADIGGRYSALSYFGLVPVALFGVDVNELLQRTLRMLHACSSCIECRDNPGLQLGASLGELATQNGRDKVTLVMPGSLSTLGLWLEQLIAESTGKEGTGLVPIAEEPVGEPGVYGDDRVFAYVRPADDPGLDGKVEALRQAGQPVVTLGLKDRLDIGQEFYRWEIATAVAGGVLGINPFDQPNVQESKDNTNRLLAQVRETGRLPAESATASGDAFEVFGGDLRGLLNQVRPGDYIALCAYLTEDAATDRALTSIRVRLRERLRVATTAGYGPRYLHSTGQLHKGGPNTGVYLLLTADEQVDAQVVGQPYTFGQFIRAQALGELESLRRHGRRVVRIHLKGDVQAGLAGLGEALEAALAARA
jgi:transaldolase/glucose-6-phosphate isomerase